MAMRMVRLYEPNRPMPLPVDLGSWLPADDPVYLLGEIVD